MSEIPTGETQSFATKFAHLRKEYGEEGKQALEKIYQECLADDTYIPSNFDVLSLLNKLDFAEITYPDRKESEDNKSYSLRLRQFLSSENITSKDTHKKITGAVAGILEK